MLNLIKTYLQALIQYSVAYFHMNIVKIKRRIAPGIPNIPTINAVIRLIPICNPHIAPTMLIIYNKITPNIEFKISFKIIFIGTIKIFPTIIIPIMQAIYISNIFISIFSIVPSQGTNL